MKKTIITSVLGLSALLFSIGSQAAIEDRLESALAGVCASVEADDQVRFRKKVNDVRRNFNLRIRDFYEGVSCQGKTLIEYAIEKNAEGVGSYVARRIASEADTLKASNGQSVSQWINANGHAGHPIAKALVD